MAAPFSLSDYVYAHRGLWSADGPPENSLAAFRAAADVGMGLEFDVRLSADGIPMCFHDRTLERMTGIEGAFGDATAAALSKTVLLESDETIPTLETLLSTWQRDLPLLVEMKALDGPAEALAEAVATALTAYTGRAAAMSFNPEAVAMLPKALPRGLLIDKTEKTGSERFETAMARALDLQVDYLSVWHTDAPLAAGFAQAHGLGLVVWTVKTPEEAAAAAPHVDAQIIEGFDPALVQPSRQRYIAAQHG
ncbi:MAG: glycerophosphodiester phosphodiesterase family protein [Pseudomonadota bacterium]